MKAQTIINKEYGRAKNFITPNVYSVGIINTGKKYIDAYEISSGNGIFSRFMVGVSTVRYFINNDTTSRSALESKSFSGDNLQELFNDAEEWIKQLRKRIREEEN